MPSSMILAAATDVAELDGRRVGHGLWAIGAIEVVAQDRGDGTVGARTDVDTALAGSLDAFGAVDAHQPEDAETGTKTLLRVRLGLEDQFNQADGCWTDLSGLAPQPGRRPIGVAPVCTRHVVGQRGVSMRYRAADMHGDADIVMKDLHRTVGDARLDYFANQAVGHGIPMAVHVDVVVQPRPTALPLGVFEGFGRQRQQGGALDRFKQRLPAAADAAHGAGVQLIDEFADRGVEFAE